ncbi:GntR family transcriptional regulator [Rhodococcus sp. D2-41]|uniref:GntR family transcriptional regulator n=1 Tax=Speluncibacter jeojiensis TaxID=2710754 RepID=A0A9X4RDN4_9ACTN|nr:GntR family transcriptional regulator [Rhodococcus sp. D2-41]MDG3011747.1 GntR family transcriptional regulator [Rhodococcus sp. D2-41]MDG3014899.1 GntR family transcriptional regulator [Corynebacteriales bacterium D3-21]
MLLRVDHRSEVPLYRQLADSVRAAVVRDELRPGERLPSAREVAEALEVNLHTVLKAYHQLREEGLVELRRGRGAVIARAGRGDDRDYGRLRDALGVVADEAQRLGLSGEAVAALLRDHTDPRAHTESKGR